MTLRALAVGLAALLVALPACGGEDPTPDAAEQDEATYEQELRAIDDTLRRAAEELPTATSPDALAQVATDVSARLGEAAERLDRVEPPGDVAEPHGRLTEAMNRAADEAQTLAESAQNGQVLDADALETMTDALAEVEDALREIEAEGYEVRERT